MTDAINHKDRAHALLSASSAHRWLNCPPSAVAAEMYPQQDTEFTREGTLAHEVAEITARKALGMPAPDYPEGTTAEVLECARGYADYIQEHIKSEDAIVLLEQRVDYSPWAPEGFGTCDCIILQGNTLTIIDYKYGQGVPVSAVANDQLWLYALGALNDFGIAYDVTMVDMHIYQPRLNNVSADAIKPGSLLEWGDGYVTGIATKAFKGEGEYAAGAWCKFCPHAGKCRKLTEFGIEYVTTHDFRTAVPVLAPFEVAEVLRMKPLIELWLKRVESQALLTLLDGGEVPGYKAVTGRARRTWADELEAGAVLAKAGYALEDYTKTEVLSPAAMEKALGKKKVAELLGGHILTMPGAPTIAPMSDKRPVYDRLAEAKEDFN